MPDATPPPGSVVRPIPLGRVNAYLIRGKKPILVDTGFPGCAPKILTALREEGYDPEDLALIIITHAHLDHFGSATVLSRTTGAPVLAATCEADALRSGAGLPPVPRSLPGRIFSVMIGKPVPSAELAVVPAVSISAPFRLDEYGIDGTVLVTPGHTRGSLSVVLATGECMAGDLVMGMFPPGRPGLPMFAEDMEAVTKSIRGIMELRPSVIYTGHGGPFSCSQLAALPGVMK